MKRCTCAVLFCFAIFGRRAEAQIDFGTVIVVGVSQDKVVIAADTRSASQDSHGRCKVAVLGGKLLYGAAGVVADTASALPNAWVFDAMGVAKTSFDGAPKRMQACAASSSCPSDPKSVPENVAQGWLESIMGNLSTASYVAMDDWKLGAGVTGIVAGIGPSGDMEAVVDQVVCQKPDGQNAEAADKPRSNCQPHLDFSKKILPPKGRTVWIPLGISDTANEYLRQTSDRAKAEVQEWPKLQEWQIAYRLVDLTLAYSQKKDYVGGPIEVVELRRNGTVTWIQNPQSCPAK
jgi:hypothetical protein